MTHAGLPRRLAAIVYDLLLLVALLMVATLALLLVSGAENVPRVLLQAWVLLISFAFFGWFWTHGGQTLGMRAWRLKLVRDSGGAVGWADAARRFLAAILAWLPAGLGFIWSLFDRERLAWHDRLSHTRLVITPKVER